MSTKINASTAGVGGLITDADNSGILEIQTAGVTRQYIDANGNISMGGIGAGQRLFVDSGTYLWTAKFNSSNVVATAVEIGNSTTRTWEIAVGGSSPAGALPAGGLYLYDQAAGQARLAINTAGVMQFNSGFGSLGNAYGCRAWVNFNGIGTVAIRASGNVSSITDGGTGIYTVNFTTAMPDANYGSTAITSDDSSAAAFAYLSGTTGSASTSSIIVRVVNTGGTPVDRTTVAVNIHR